MFIPPLTATKVAALIAAFRAAAAPVPAAAEAARPERDGAPRSEARPPLSRAPDASHPPHSPAPTPVPRDGLPAPSPALVRQAMLAELLGAAASGLRRPELRPDLHPADGDEPNRPPASESGPHSEPADPVVRLAIARLAHAARALSNSFRAPLPLAADDGLGVGAGLIAPDPTELFEPADDDVHLAARRVLDAAYLKAAAGARVGAALIAREAPEPVLAGLDRRMLFAVAVGPESLFGAAERRTSLLLLYRRAAEVLWPTPPRDGHVSPDRLRAYTVFLDAAGPEERRSVEWLMERAAADVHLARMAPAAVGDPEPARSQTPAVALVRSALDALAGGSLRAADAAPATPMVLRETPLIAGGFLGQEMLLAALAAARRVVLDQEDRPDAAPRRRLVRRAPLPGETYIRPLQGDWRDVVDPSADMAAWEAETGLALPEAYRRFLVAYNGGHVYPNVFDAPEVWPRRLERLHEFATVAEFWRDAVDSRGETGLLAIGRDAEGGDVLLSLRPQDFGAVIVESVAEGDDLLREIVLAEDFVAFLDGLADGPELDGFRSWDRPSLRRLVRRLAF